MKIYDTANNALTLTVELEAEGYKWADSKMSTEQSYFDKYGSETTVIADASTFRKFMQYCDVAYQIEDRPNEQIIEYKAKGDNMTQEENKKNVLLSRLAPIANAIKTSIADDITTEVVLTSAMEGAKNLSREIGEYLESRKSKFKVGDYVVLEYGSVKSIMRVEQISKVEKDMLYMDCLTYETTHNNIIENDRYLINSSLRHASPEEISEYKVALSFHKHGRKPFEVRAGDVVEKSDGDRVFVAYENSLSKEDFISGKFVLVGTKEEFNEWMVNK